MDKSREETGPLKDETMDMEFGINHSLVDLPLSCVFKDKEPPIFAIAMENYHRPADLTGNKKLSTPADGCPESSPLLPPVVSSSLIFNQIKEHPNSPSNRQEIVQYRTFTKLISSVSRIGCALSDSQSRVVETTGAVYL
ncbi:uncharacterized protein PGTG_12831 [Puccinia graminis f. sp. tritici CRL 75-36-700-3]|uniref:Uncharacterized protein n=1 Tax=Puccinia graminis f. sp. tritici (strain CRL 75-36-700-3 / race SCCL) TaxID=418459 RepID=E3KSG1_PUCGT|nr:uncharacterized protein PGTG_12831 [Puccinia graminis f. sp. tritici CRL 75-36-700-3]EFP87247.1 hypothetical protein PGTG_12831 [Puccinia graminis f. sp. tritici CRL 75-36-700-3]